jgi:phage baseplate assembly protein W
MNVDFPFHLDMLGRTARAVHSDHIRNLIERVLFTSPGERVNRPSFGTGLKQLIFAPNSDELVAVTQTMVQGALQQWLGDLIKVDAVHVERDESRLLITVQYVILREQQQQVARFTHFGP